MEKRAISYCALQDFLNSAKSVLLVSGEGTEGVIEYYSLSRFIPSMKKYLTKERQNGDRFAYFDVDGRRLDFIKYFCD